MSGIDQWNGCYADGWKNMIGDDAFSHPAKYSRSLIQRIYAHLAECGRIAPGMVVLDPFGGVALGALDAMFHGLTWVGCELEKKFHQLGLENIALWNERFRGWPGWGKATLLNGDSRRLCEVVKGCELVVSSPPYAESPVSSLDSKSASGGQGNAFRRTGKSPRARNAMVGEQYGHTPGQLGSLKEGDLDAVISSPPYVSGGHHTDVMGAWNANGGGHGVTKGEAGYGQTAGQLGQMKEGSVDAVLSSPPYADSVLGSKEYVARMERLCAEPFESLAPRWQREVTKYQQQKAATSHCQLTDQGYGVADGQLGAMPPGDVADVVVSSPPFADSTAGRGQDELTKSKSLGHDYDERMQYEKRGFLMGKDGYQEYAQTCNLGSFRECSNTFWQAARTIMEQCHLFLKPGGVAVFVVKAFVRKGKIVDFPGQWRTLCEAVGFRSLHEHRAMLVVEQGTQMNLFDEPEKLTKERKSFFRRLAEKKGSPPIDYEVVLCMEK